MIEIKDGWLKKTMLKAIEEYNKLPDWLKIPKERFKNARSYSDL